MYDWILDVGPHGQSRICVNADDVVEMGRYIEIIAIHRRCRYYRRFQYRFFSIYRIGDKRNIVYFFDNFAYFF